MAARLGARSGEARPGAAGLPTGVGNVLSFSMAEHRGPRTRTGARYSESGAAAFQLLQEIDRSAALWDGQEVSRGRLSLLRVLATSGAMTMSDVARARSTTRQGVQRLAGALVDEGWLELQENPRHRRAPLLALTPAGLAAYQELAQQEAERLNELVRGIPADELRGAVRVLERLRRAAEPADA